RSRSGRTSVENRKLGAPLPAAAAPSELTPVSDTFPTWEQLEPDGSQYSPNPSRFQQGPLSFFAKTMMAPSGKLASLGVARAWTKGVRRPAAREWGLRCLCVYRACSAPHLHSSCSLPLRPLRLQSS